MERIRVAHPVRRQILKMIENDVCVRMDTVWYNTETLGGVLVPSSVFCD